MLPGRLGERSSLLGPFWMVELSGRACRWVRGISIRRGSLWIAPDPVENAQNAFPTRSLDAQEHVHTLHKASLMDFVILTNRTQAVR